MLRGEWSKEQFEIRNQPGVTVLPTELLSWSVQLGLKQRIARRWNVLANAKPTYGAAPDLIDRERGWLFQGALLLQYVKDSNNLIGGGIALSSALGEPRLLPVLQWFRSWEKTSLQLLLPSRAHFYWQVSPNLKVGGGLGIQGNLYQLNHELPRFGFLVYTKEIRFSNLFFGPSIHWKFFKGMHLFAEPGLALRRSYIATNEFDVRADHSLENGLYFKTGLYYGLR